jgi:hypothetical protein
MTGLPAIPAACLAVVGDVLAAEEPGRVQAMKAAYEALVAAGRSRPKPTPGE